MFFKTSGFYLIKQKVISLLSKQDGMISAKNDKVADKSHLLE